MGRVGGLLGLAAFGAVAVGHGHAGAILATLHHLLRALS